MVSRSMFCLQFTSIFHDPFQSESQSMKPMHCTLSNRKLQNVEDSKKMPKRSMPTQIASGMWEDEKERGRRYEDITKMPLENLGDR